MIPPLSYCAKRIPERVCNPRDFRYDLDAPMKLPFQRARAVAPAVSSQAEFPPLFGADIAGMAYGRRVGGDFYRFLRANPCRVVLGLLDIAGRYEENQAIVAAARRTFDELGSGKFANQEINEADAMMEL